MMILAASFVPLIVLPGDTRAGRVTAATALLVTTAVLAVGSAAVFPFEMDTVVSLANNRLIGTHYGSYNTIVGVGILVGNLATGSLMQATRHLGQPWLLWILLSAIGLASAAALYRLDRRRPPQPVELTPTVRPSPADRRGRPTCRTPHMAIYAIST